MRILLAYQEGYNLGILSVWLPHKFCFVFFIQGSIQVTRTLFLTGEEFSGQYAALHSPPAFWLTKALHLSHNSRVLPLQAPSQHLLLPPSPLPRYRLQSKISAVILMSTPETCFHFFQTHITHIQKNHPAFQQNFYM